MDARAAIALQPALRASLRDDSRALPGSAWPPARASRHPHSIGSPQGQPLRRPVESAQYTSIDYTQTLADHHVLASVGSAGDAYDNAMAESFVDTFKTELMADRVWQTKAQVELAIVEWIGWYNHARLHSALDDRPPVQFENSTLGQHGPRESASPTHT